MSSTPGECEGSGEITFASTGAKARPFYSHDRRPRGRLLGRFPLRQPPVVEELASQPIFEEESMATRTEAANGTQTDTKAAEAALRRMAEAEPELAARLVIQSLP